MMLEYIPPTSPTQNLVEKLYRQIDYTLWSLRERGYSEQDFYVVIYLTKEDYELLISNSIVYVSENIKPTFMGYEVVDTSYHCTQVIVGLRNIIR